MTAQLDIQTETGKRMRVRALLDTGLSVSLIISRVVTQAWARKNLTSNKHNRNSRKSSPTKPLCHFVQKAETLQHPENAVNVTAVLIDLITKNLPAQPISRTEEWEAVCNLQLADSAFYLPEESMPY